MEEADRLSVLQRYGVLDTPPERDFDDLTGLVARLFGVPTATVTLLDGARQWVKSGVGVAARETPREGALCAHQLEQAEPLVLEDVQADPRFASARGEPQVRFYASVPLRSREGAVLGALCVMDVRPRHLEPGQRELLELLGRQAERLLELRRLERERDEAARAERARDVLLDRQRALEQALAEERRLLREVLRQLPVGVMMVGPRLELANAAAERLLGEPVRPPLHDAPRGWRLLLPDGTPCPRERLPLVRALERGEVVQGELLEVERADGTRAWVEVTGVPVRGADGGVRAAVAALVDVTEHRHVLALQQKLLAVAGHDLRNPLYAIQLSVQRLEKEPGLGAGALQAVARVRRSATRMDRLVHDLLDYVSVRSGGALGVDVADADLGPVCEAAVAEFAATHPDRKLELDGEGDGRGVFDPDRLGQLVRNLVGNVLQHAERGAPVRVAWSGQAPGALLLAVHTPGTVVPPELQPHLFEPFRPGGGDGAPGSLGLGLFLVEQVARAHGGQVAVHSAPGEGTTFTVRLPRVAHEQGEPHPPAGT